MYIMIFVERSYLTCLSHRCAKWLCHVVRFRTKHSQPSSIVIADIRYPSLQSSSSTKTLHLTKLAHPPTPLRTTWHATLRFALTFPQHVPIRSQHLDIEKSPLKFKNSILVLLDPGAWQEEHRWGAGPGRIQPVRVLHDSG